MPITKYDLTRKYTAEFLRDFDTLELNVMLSEIRLILHELRTQNAPFKGISGPVPNDIWKKVKKDKARVLTILKEMQVCHAK